MGQANAGITERLLEESKPYLAAIGRGLDRWETDRAHSGALAEARKMARRIKGAASVMGIDAAARQAAALERELARAMAGNGEVTSLRASVLAIEGLLTGCGAEPGGEVEEVPSEFLGIFRREADERIQTITRGLRTLAADPENQAALREVQRATHTLKGAAGVMGLRRASRLAHRLEDLLLETWQAPTPEAHLRMAAAVEALAEACAVPPAGRNENHTLEPPGEMRHFPAGRRQVPFGSLTARLGHLVRVTAEQLGKLAELTVGGERVEMDRSALEALAEPLEHLLRNALDHGIETPMLRAAAGKPLRGRIRVLAHQWEDHVTIEVGDDGAGIDLATLRSKTPHGDSLSTCEALALAFEPGLSAASAVTETSGRGIGLAVVKEAVDGLRGSVSVDSDAGKGCVFRLTLPVRRASAGDPVRVIEVEAGGETYAVPWDAVAQVLPFGGGDATALSLARLLGSCQEPAGPRSPALAVDIGGTRVTWSVDRVGRTRRVAIRPLGPVLEHVPGVAGAAVDEEGRIVLVLDPANLMDRIESEEPAEPYLVSKAS